MSQVTMCDACGVTSRTSTETAKLDLPRGMVPEMLHGLAANATAPTIKLDVCQACQSEVAEMFDALIGRRFGGGQVPEEKT